MFPSTSVESPPPILHPNDTLTKQMNSEEPASLWPWAWPELLGWPFEVTWLFSPVNTRANRPGDIWGVDATGELLIVETKHDLELSKLDPFKDFVGFTARQRVRDTRSSLTADSLAARWHKYYRMECNFLKNQADQFFRSSEPTEGTFPGVVPYSYHRHRVWHWQRLYLDRIAPRIQSEAYQRAVWFALEARRQSDEPSPHFFGLILNLRDTTPKLPDHARQRAITLRQSEGPQRVHLRVVRATLVRDDMVRIDAWSQEIVE